MEGKTDKLEQRIKEMMEMIKNLQDNREHSSKAIIKEEILSFNGKPVNTNRYLLADLWMYCFLKRKWHVSYYLNQRGNVTNQDWIRNKRLASTGQNCVCLIHDF